MTCINGKKMVALDTPQRNMTIEKIGRTSGRLGEIRHWYDEMGRISEKLFPEGMRTKWLYDERGQLRELVHEDDRGILDRYR